MKDPAQKEKNGPAPTYISVDLAVTRRRTPGGRDAPDRPQGPGAETGRPAASAAAPAARPTAGELFRDHASFVWRVVAGHGVAPSDVQDVTQEVFLVAFRKLEEWDPARASAASWLYAIAIRVAANHRRLARVRRETPGEVPQAAVTPDPAGSIDRTRLLAQLDAALVEMEPRRRDVFILFEIAEQSMHDVARTVGCPLKTAYKRLYAARREVAARFGVVWGSPGAAQDDAQGDARDDVHEDDDETT
jgi:RNA polymerase sigma-70 factor (ECF subfamily)